VDSKNLLDRVSSYTSLFLLPERLKADNTIRVNHHLLQCYFMLTLEGFLFVTVKLKSITLNVLARSDENA
ncbi:hypothetical protein Tco_0262808, partial [Tanacetum coccineum]